MLRALSAGRTRAAALAAFAALATAGGAAPAADQVAACIDAHERAQAARRDGKLIEARRALLGCDAPACPVAIRHECAGLHERVEASQPTVVVEARDRQGADVTAVRVFVDGVLVLERLDGKAFAVDPGERSMRYEFAGTKAAEERVVVREGERNRKLVVTVGAPAPSPPPAALSPAGPRDGPASRPGSAWPYVTAGVGAAALGSFAYFALSGRARFDRLKDECAPPAHAGCPADDVRGVRTRLALADVSLGVGLVAIAASAYLFVARPAAKPAVSVSAGPTPGGGAAALTGSF